MKISRAWLQTYFEKPLPETALIADTFTFHSFEIESVEGDILDIKVLPNRAADCLSHRGIAKEFSALINIPLKRDPLRESIPAFPETKELSVTVDEAYVLRHTAALVRGVTVGPSPEWLTVALTSVGQRSINNVVDILNFVMLDIGQPSGAFDAGKIVSDKGVFNIAVRRAKNGEKITILSGEEYSLTDSMFVFTDATEDSLLDIAGIKGGLASGITEKTTDLFISVGNYDGSLIRKASQKLKLFSDASLRYQNRPSPDLTLYGMKAILALITEVAGGTVVGVIDTYPRKSDRRTVSVSATEVSEYLGATYTDTDVADVFQRLDLPFVKEKDLFTVTPPFERTDLLICEDLIEEVGRIIGYDHVLPKPLPPVSIPPDQSRFKGIERMKDMLIEKGFIEVSTQSFEKTGEVYLENPLDKTKPALRPSLEHNLTGALEHARLYASLLLAPNEKPKLFEVGTVFPKVGEYVELRMTEAVPEWGDKAGTSDNLSIAKLEEYGKDYTPQQYDLASYQPFSPYPFVLRDIALWVPSGTGAEKVSAVIATAARQLLVKCALFDVFEKEGNTSYAFRLVFESMEKTLTDIEVNGYMELVIRAIEKEGWRVR